MARLPDTIDLHKLHINDGIFSEFMLNNSHIENFSISNSTFEILILPGSPLNKVSITKSLASRVSGASSHSGLPSWVQLDLVDTFDSVQTVAEIKKAGLSPAHEILVAILKKTFMQKGSGRKEEALLRGFGAGISKKISTSILNLLIREDILKKHKGDEGWVYVPSRSETARISKILADLRSSSDALWAAVDEFNAS